MSDARARKQSNQRQSRRGEAFVHGDYHVDRGKENDHADEAQRERKSALTGGPTGVEV
jgi:hypothetical protein